jgi:hypothetical protein
LHLSPLTPCPPIARTPLGHQLILDRRVVLLVPTARGGEAADADPVSAGVDSKKALEHRRLVDVEPKCEQGVKRSSGAAGEGKDALGGVASAVAEDNLVLAARLDA